jgi:hypothetical protein
LRHRGQLRNGSAQSFYVVVRVNPMHFGARVTGELLADFGCNARVCELRDE